MRFVDVTEARQGPGLRVVIAAGVPSPWSQAAMATFDIAGVDYLAVRFRRTSEDVKEWTGHHNAPVAMYENEPARTGWAEILALAERLAPAAALLPGDHESRLKTLGLGHEILGEGGLAWNVRLLLLHAGLTTDGARGWPRALAEYLAPKYGYAPDRVERARDQAIATLGLLGRMLGGGEYFFEGRVTVADVYVATGLGPLVAMPHDLCPMLPLVRHAFQTLDHEVRDTVPAVLIRHRDMMYSRHLPVPLRL